MLGGICQAPSVCWRLLRGLSRTLEIGFETWCATKKIFSRRGEEYGLDLYPLLICG